MIGKLIKETEMRKMLCTGCCVALITLYAGCPLEGIQGSPPVTVTLTGMTLASALTWITAHQADNSVYTIVLDRDETTGPLSVFFINRKNMTIIIKSSGGNRIISLNVKGVLFTVGPGVTLVVEDNIELKGRSDNDACLVHVGFSYESEWFSGAFVLNGGSITANRSGGVLIKSGTFTMKGGVISGITTESAVLVSYYESSTYPYTAGNARFDMSGGEISGNTGGGVYVTEYGSFSMTGGEISGNTASYGGGVCTDVYGGGTFIKTGGAIYGSDASAALKNTATDGTNEGHAVYMYHGPYYGVKRNTTAGPGVTLDSAIYGAAGGWE
jgi:hypothetical protein